MLDRRTFAKNLVAGIPLLVGGATVGGLFTQARAQTETLSDPNHLGPISLPPPYDNSVIAGVRMGAETYSFHDAPHGRPDLAVPLFIDYIKKLRLTECQVMAAQIEPLTPNGSGWWKEARNSPTYPAEREAGRRWRLNTPISFYENIRKQFDDAGIEIYIYNENFNETYTDEERDAVWRGAKALGASAIMSSDTISEARRLAPFAAKYKMFYAAHNHNNDYDPDQFGTPDSLEAVLAMSPWMRVNLDVGHFTAGNNDAVAFIKKHHDRVLNIHVRDRKRDNGRNTPLGEGDAPIKEVLRLIRDNKWPIRCYVELEYGSFRPPVEEVERSLDYCRQCLLSS